MTVLAIVPARGGSKGIPRKNLLPILGKPLLCYSIEHAMQSRLIDRVVVSSEDAEILEVARRAGAETPFVRPPELAGDDVLDWPVFEHALRWFEENEGYCPDLVVHLRPTTPYRRICWIDEAIDLLRKNGTTDSLRSVSAPEKHPYRMFRIGENGFLDPIMKHEHDEPYLLRRQDLPPVFYYNCVLDVTRRDTILEQYSMTGENMMPYVMDPSEVVDIDSRRDIYIAEQLIQTTLSGLEK